MEYGQTRNAEQYVYGNAQRTVFTAEHKQCEEYGKGLHREGYSGRNTQHSADAYYLIGKILYEQDDKLGALSFVKKAISIDPVHEDANEFLLELKH